MVSVLTDYSPSYSCPVQSEKELATLYPHIRTILFQADSIKLLENIRSSRDRYFRNDS